MKKLLLLSLSMVIFITSCSTEHKNTSTNKIIEETKPSSKIEKSSLVEQFADIKVLRYDTPQWNALSLKQKKLVYYLTQAGLSGRDIMYDQNYKYNLTIRRALENIYTQYQGDKNTDKWKSFEIYLKQIWFANGIHHHYSMEKFNPEFSKEYLTKLLNATKTTLKGDAFEVIFNDTDSKKFNLDPTKGLIESSAINFYGADITTKEVTDFSKYMTKIS